MDARFFDFSREVSEACAKSLIEAAKNDKEGNQPSVTITTSEGIMSIIEQDLPTCGIHRLTCRYNVVGDRCSAKDGQCCEEQREKEGRYDL